MFVYLPCYFLNKPNFLEQYAGVVSSSGLGHRVLTSANLSHEPKDSDVRDTTIGPLYTDFMMQADLKLHT